MIREHYEAVKALIPSKFTVYLFDTPANPAFPYVVVWGNPGGQSTESLSSTLDEFTADGRVTCVGANYASCLIVAQGVVDALNKRAPVVAGRHCQPLRLSPALDIQADRDVVVPATNTHPIFCVYEFTLQSEPS